MILIIRSQMYGAFFLRFRAQQLFWCFLKNNLLCFLLIETTATTTTTPTTAHGTTTQRTNSFSSTPSDKKSTTENGQQTKAFIHTTKPEGTHHACYNWAPIHFSVVILAHVSSTTETEKVTGPTQKIGAILRRRCVVSAADSPSVMVTMLFFFLLQTFVQIAMVN